MSSSDRAVGRDSSSSSLAALDVGDGAASDGAASDIRDLTTTLELKDISTAVEPAAAAEIAIAETLEG